MKLSEPVIAHFNAVMEGLEKLMDELQKEGELEGKRRIKRLYHEVDAVRDDLA